MAMQQHLQQSQQLSMTRELLQSIELLQMSQLELAGFIHQEIEKNPLLEKAGDDASSDTVEEPSDAASDSSAEQGVDTLLSRDVEPRAQGAESGDDAWNSGIPEYTYDHASRGGSGFGEDSEAWEQRLSRPPNLYEHLHTQIQLEAVDDTTRLVAWHIVDLLDESGYLHTPLEDIAEQLGCSVVAVQKGLECVQGLDPTGVGARDLGECLWLQLREQGEDAPGLRCFLDNLDLYATRMWRKLARITGASIDDIKRWGARIKALNPRPGSAFGSEGAQTVRPDIYLYEQPDGSWGIELNTDTLPRPLVNRRYYTELKTASRGENEAQRFLSEQLQHANWLVRAVDQRARTVLNVTREIVRQQEGFFRHGVSHLVPMTLREISEKLGVHESTISRVASQKYLHTPRGLFELRYFFVSGVSNSAGTAHVASTAVKERIKRLIDKETPTKILSDEAIAMELLEEGITIARRTVAKYRESLGIPASSIRRRAKRAVGDM